MNATIQQLQSDNHHKDTIIHKLERTVTLQEKNISEIVKELQEVNKFYSESQMGGIMNEVMNIMQVDDQSLVIQALNDIKKKNKLANQFVEKSWKFMN